MGVTTLSTQASERAAPSPLARSSPRSFYLSLVPGAVLDTRLYRLSRALALGRSAQSKERERSGTRTARLFLNAAQIQQLQKMKEKNTLTLSFFFFHWPASFDASAAS